MNRILDDSAVAAGVLCEFWLVTCGAVWGVWDVQAGMGSESTISPSQYR